MKSARNKVFSCSRDCSKCGKGIPDSLYISGDLCLDCIKACTSCGKPNEPHEKRSLCQPCGQAFMAAIHGEES